MKVYDKIMESSDNESIITSAYNYVIMIKNYILSYL